MKQRRILKLTHWIGLALLLLMALGLDCKVKGTRQSNIPPEVKFANIPADGTSFTSQPVVHWFGKDVDGFVDKYQYVIFKASQIELLAYYDTTNGLDSAWLALIKDIPPETWLDSLNRIGVSLTNLGEDAVEPIELKTNGGAGQTSDKVKLFASDDTTEVILQFLFLRAVDNQGAISDSIPFRTFSRTNHPPNTSIVDFDNNEEYYTLDQFTQTWTGIPIGWSGKDSVDVPFGEPDLEFFWELFGPSPTGFDTTVTNLVAISYDTTDGDKWVRDKTTILPPGLQTGFYTFKVQARDDAFIPDPTPTTTVFKVIKPTFNKDVMMVDLTFYGVPTFFGYPSDSTPVRTYYRQLFQTAGFPLDTIYNGPQPDSAPSESLISEYKAVVVINLDNKLGMSDSLARQLVKFMDVGGKVWIEGIYSFTSFGSFNACPRTVSTTENELTRSLNAGARGFVVDIASKYCGLRGYFMACWEFIPDSLCGTGGCQFNAGEWKAFPEGRNEEFIGAVPLLGSFPALETDTNNVKKISVIRSTGPTTYNKFSYYKEVPCVNYAVIYSAHPNYPTLPPAKAVYLGNSSYGSGSVLNGKPVVVRYAGPTYQTAVFTFPLFYIKMNQSVNVVTEMMNWFGIF